MRLTTLLLLLTGITVFGQDTAKLRSFGALPTPIEELRKMTFALPPSGAAGTFPSAHEVNIECPPVTDQCLIGSCTSEAAGYGLCSMLARRESQWTYYLSSGVPDRAHLYSPMYLHYFIKKCANSCRNCGAALGDAMKYLSINGIPALKSWAPDQRDSMSCLYQPPVSSAAFRISNYNPLFLDQNQQSVRYSPTYRSDIIRAFIAQDNPIPISIWVDKSFENGTAFNNADDTWKTFVGRSPGSHSMLVVGYNDNRAGGAFLVMNSWGTTTWNLNRNDPNDGAKPGFCWIAYDLIDVYCFDAFVVNQLGTFSSISVPSLINTSISVVNQPETAPKPVTFAANLDFFVTNRYNPYDSIRLIPTNIDKGKGEATVAIYRVQNDTPLFFSAFNIKVGEQTSFQVNGKKYTFKALYIKPWKKFVGIIDGKDALFYEIIIGSPNR